MAITAHTNAIVKMELSVLTWMVNVFVLKDGRAPIVLKELVLLLYGANHVNLHATATPTIRKCKKNFNFLRTFLIFYKFTAAILGQVNVFVKQDGIVKIVPDNVAF